MRTLTIAYVLFAALVLASVAFGKNIIGTSGPDTLNGTPDIDFIDGKAGNDHLYGGKNHDELRCGDGNDVCYGGLGYDTITGGAGADRMYGGCNGGCVDTYGNVFYGGGGDDIIGADNSKKDDVTCGTGYDIAYIDWNDDWNSDCNKVIIDGSGRDLPTETGETDTGEAPTE